MDEVNRHLLAETIHVALKPEAQAKRLVETFLRLRFRLQ